MPSQEHIIHNDDSEFIDDCTDEDQTLSDNHDDEPTLNSDDDTDVDN